MGQLAVLFFIKGKLVGAESEVKLRHSQFRHQRIEPSPALAFLLASVTFSATVRTQKIPGRHLLWILNRAHVEGTFEPEDVELLGKLLTETIPDDATDDEREAHAVLVIQLFKQGIRPAILQGTGDNE